MPGYQAEIVEGYCNTNRKAGRLRILGKGRYGNRLIVRNNGKVVLDHNSAETYRKNVEVEIWVREEIKKCKSNAKMEHHSAPA